MTVQFVLYIHVDIMIVQSIETFGWCFLVRRAGETVFNNLSWALLTWSQSTSVTSVSVFKMLGKNLPSIFRYTRAAGTWDQVSMEWHPKNPHCEDHGEVVHWATSRWDISMVPPPGRWSQILQGWAILHGNFQQNGTKWPGGFTIEWDGVQQGTDCHPTKPKNTQRFKYDEDYHSSKSYCLT